MDAGKVDGAATNFRALIFALLALACGHMLSTLLRTIPAISLDLMAADFGTPPQTLASLTSIYHFAFAASQIPVGAAMDRFGVRPVSLSLLAGTIVGAMASGFATGPESFLFGQFLLGVATSGMLMCPMTLAAKQMSAARFGLWSGVILSIGNIGMLLSSSPLALGRRAYGLARRLLDLRGRSVLPSRFAVLHSGSETTGGACRHLVAAVADGRSPASRPVASASRPDRAGAGLVGGLTGVAGIMGGSVADAGQGAVSRVEAGNELGVFTIALIVGPLCIGMFDRKFGHRRAILAVTHFLAAVFLCLMAAGAPHYPVSDLVQRGRDARAI